MNRCSFPAPRRAMPIAGCPLAAHTNPSRNATLTAPAMEFTCSFS